MKLTQIVRDLFVGFALTASLGCSSYNPSGDEPTGVDATTHLDPDNGVYRPIKSNDSLSTSNEVTNYCKPTPFTKTFAGDNYVHGDANAPVEMVWFNDFQGPYCHKFWKETLNTLDNEYVSKGLLKIIIRDFPLEFHPQAQQASEAAECAGAQGNYWEYANGLFADQPKFSDNGFFTGLAKDLGLNTTNFNNCLAEGTYAQEVQKDSQDGEKLGIQGTPGFLINGEIVSGAQPYSVFKETIDAQLDNLCIKH